MADRIMLDSSAANHVQAYINYHNLVGDNGGKLLSEKEYEDFQKNYAQVMMKRYHRNQKIEFTAPGRIPRVLIVN